MRFPRCRHQLDHLLLAACVFIAGALFERTHRFHHQVIK